MKLSILIPTYNRAPFLLKNLEMLSDYILKGTFQEEIEIVISNNKSTDSTDEKVIQFQNQNTDIQLQYFTQDENIGLEKNALFVLKQAKGEYVMYLGDDDYIEFEYLSGVVENLTTNRNISVVLRDKISIDENGNLLNRRRLPKPNKYYEAGFDNCLKNSWRGHQLSGLVLKREGLLEKYTSNAVSNIYPFIFFVAYSCLIGSTFDFQEYPVKVTIVSQNKKDWNYGSDGLLNEIFDNYKKLPLNILEKTILELNHYYNQSWRLWNYKKQSNLMFFHAFLNIIKSNNSTFVFKIVFPIIVLLQIIKKAFFKFK